MIAQTLDAHGLDSAELFRESGMDPTRLRQPGARFSIEAIATLYRLAVERTGNPALGLEVARHWHPTTMHALGYSWLASTTLRDAVERFSRIVSDAAQMKLTPGPTASWIELDLNLEPAAHAAIDAVLAVLMSICRLLLGESLNAKLVMMMYAEPTDLTPYRECFRSPVQFNAPRHGLLIDNSALDVPLATANPELVRANDQVIGDYLTKLDSTRFSHRVRSNVISILSGGHLQQEGIARNLNVSLRSLQRRLSDEGTSFRAILDSTRQELAPGYLADDRYSISEVAYVLGYSESGSFSKAFNRWYGCSPKAWRLQNPGRRSAV